MLNNIKKDLALFNQIIDEFLISEINTPVSKRIDPEKVIENLDVSLKESALSENDFKEKVQELVFKTPKTSSKLFFNQLFGGRHSKAVLGDLLAVMLNNSMATYKIAGPQVLVEKEIIKKVCEMVGYNEDADGTFPTGGSMSNFMSLIMARDKHNLNIRKKGISNSLVAYASENAHYSISKNASFSGLGKNNVRYIACDKYGAMKIETLEKAIQDDIAEGFIPFYVNATAGTTVLGSFDPIKEISDLCKTYNMWLHVDGAFLGSVIFSDKYKKLIKGVEFSDSFCFNAHKTLGTPLSCSIIVVREQKDLHNSFNNSADYLYQTNNNQYNLGQTSFECGRRNNALKFWTLWKSIGSNGIAEIIEHEFDLANQARLYINSNKHYKLYSNTETLSVCFNYKDIDPQDLCTKLYEKNILMVGYGNFQAEKFIRLVTINGMNSREDILCFFKTLESFVDEQYENLKKR